MRGPTPTLRETERETERESVVSATRIGWI
jgi:hypothetical protein